MTTSTEKRQARITYRVGLFQRRGMSVDEANTLALRLAERDTERDDRRCCAECQHWQRDGGCFQARREFTQRRQARSEGIKPGAVRPFAPIDPLPAVLQRCDGFSFQTP